MDESTLVNIGLASATFLLVYVTWRSMRASNENMQRSNALNEIEMAIRFRPTLGRTTVGDAPRKGQHGTIISENTYGFDQGKVVFHFRNFGALPAVNVGVVWFIFIKEKEKELHGKSSPEIATSEFGITYPSLAPNERYGIDILCEDVHQTSIENDDKCYFKLEIHYHDPTGRPYYYRAEGHFNKLILYLDKVELD